MQLQDFNNYVFYDKNDEEIKVGDTVLFKQEGMGGDDGWARGIISKINGKVVTIQSLEGGEGETSVVRISNYKLLDKM